MLELVAESAVERDDVGRSDEVDAGAQTPSDGERFESCHDRATRTATLMSPVDDDIDCEAVQSAVADEPPHSDCDAAVDRANSGKASLERPDALLGGR